MYDMDGFLDIVTSFPVVVFTAALIFSLTWWIISTLLGIGDEADIDVEALDFAGMPLSMSVAAVSAGGFAAAVLLTSGMRAADLSGGVVTVLSVGVLIVALYLGYRFAKLCARFVGPLYDTANIPGVDAAAGSFAVVRSSKVDDTGGEVLVTTGPVQSTVLNVLAVPGKVFGHGDQVLVIGVDDDGTWRVDDLDDLER